MRRVASAEISPAATPLYDAPLSLPRSSVGHVFMTGMSNGQALRLRSRCRNEADPTGLGALLEMPRKSPHYQPCNRGEYTDAALFPDARQNACCARGGAACTVRESSSIPPRREDKPALTGDSQTLRSNHVSKHWGSDSVTTLAHLPLKVALKSSG